MAARQAGAISGALSTMRQVGNALGVAITGAVFYGAIGGGYAEAFSRSLLEPTALPLTVALIARLLPGRQEGAPCREGGLKWSRSFIGQVRGRCKLGP